MHWAQRRRLLVPWREWTAYTWRAQRTKSDVVGVPCEVTVEIAFSRRGRRDPHNYTGTVCKAVIDQLVHEGVWPDDTSEWVHVNDPILVVGTESKVHLQPR